MWNMWNRLSRKWKLLAIVIGSVVLILLFCSFVPIMRVSYVVEETYSVTETYYVKETYTELEPYTFMEPYTDIEIHCAEPPCQQYIPIDFTITGGKAYIYPGGTGCSVEVYIENNDLIGGVFEVEFLLVLGGGVTTTITGAKYIEAGSVGKVTAAYEHGSLETPYSFSYTVITAPMKFNPTYREIEVTKYRPVIEYGEVTKERYIPEEVEVLKTRNVINYKRVSLFSYLISY